MGTKPATIPSSLRAFFIFTLVVPSALRGNSFSKPMFFFGRTSSPLQKAAFGFLNAILALSPLRLCSQELPEPPSGSLPAPALTAPAPPLTPNVTGAGAILVDALSGQVLFERNPDVPRPIASTTKIMTALLLVENLPETEIITASKTAASTRESSLHLKTGEKLTAHDLLRAILLRSANDGCVAAAERIAGSEARFAEMMNRRALELGATHTHFVNAHGLHHRDHFSTPRDLAVIARAAMLQPRIAEVVCLQKCVISRSSGSKDLSLRNHSRFLSRYAGADGVKTGWTIPAGRCYVGSVTRNGWRLISVTLKSKDYIADTASLMDYGFGRLDPVVLFEPNAQVGKCPVSEGAASEVEVVTPHRIQYIQKKGETLPVEKRLTLNPVKAPLTAGAIVGKMELFSGGQILASFPLAARNAVAFQPPTVLSRAAALPGAGKRFAIFSIIFGGCLVSLRYGKRIHKRIRLRSAASPKGTRNRRSRLAAGVRNSDR